LIQRLSTNISEKRGEKSCNQFRNRIIKEDQ